MSKCSICKKEAFFKIKEENIFYCREHAKQFFKLEDLEKIDPIKISKNQAQILKNFLENQN